MEPRTEIRPGPGGAAVAAAVSACTLAALLLRTHQTDVPFADGSQAAIPWLAAHEWGWSWLFAHPEGMLSSLLARWYAHAVLFAGGALDERAWRLPMAVCGSLLVPLTYALMRGLGCQRWSALTAAGIVAVSPPLVTDARVPFAHETLAVTLGAAVVWTHLIRLGRPSPPATWLVGIVLGLYVSSHRLAYAVPLVVVVAALIERGPAGGWRGLGERGLWLPAAVAIVLKGLAWAWHGDDGTAAGVPDGAAPDRVGLLPLTIGVLGPPWAAVCAVGTAVGLGMLARRDRRALPAVWSAAFLAPLAIWGDLLGGDRPEIALVPGAYAATLAGCALLDALAAAVAAADEPAPSLRRLIRGVGLAGAALALLGSINNQFTASRWRALTSTVDYGRAPPDRGYKAAGYYIRQFVPREAAVFVADERSRAAGSMPAFYFGRVLPRGADRGPPDWPRVLDAVRGQVDVLVVGARQRARADAWTEFERAACLRRDGRPVLYVLARRGLSLPCVDQEIGPWNAAYDREHPLRWIPTVVRTSGRTEEVERGVVRALDGPAGAEDAAAADGAAHPGRQNGGSGDAAREMTLRPRSGWTVPESPDR